MFMRSTGDIESIHDDQECLELEERGANQHRRQGSRNSVETISGIMKPSGFIRKSHFCWLGKDNSILTGTIDDQDGLRSPTDAMMPLLYSEYSLADNSSITGSQRWEQIGTASGSSVDLEWENEIGLTPPSNIGLPEELTWNLVTETTNTSWRSSPISISNGLEWDGDYTSVEVSEFIQETQKLIDDMDQRTMDTETEANNNR